MSQIDAFETSGSSPGDDIDWDAVEEQRIADQWEAAQVAQEAAEEAEFGTVGDEDFTLQWDDEAGGFKVFTDADFGYDEEPKREKPKASKEAYEAWVKSASMSMAQLFEREDPTWFIEDLVPDSPLNVLHGPGGSRKSFLALDWFLCAAYGIEWHGKKLRAGKTLYIAAEGVGGLKKRVAAWMASHDITEWSDNFIIMPKALNLASAKADVVAHWRELVDVLEIDYIVVDTLHRAMPGAEENDSKDIGTVFANATEIAGEFAQVWFLHHDSRGNGKGGRGSTSILDDSDVVLAIKLKGKEESLVSKLVSEKLKDAEPIQPVLLNFAVHGEGATSSLFIESLGKGEAESTQRGPSAVDRAIEAIRTHGLDINVGQIATSKALKAMDLGYNFGAPTVGKALSQLRAQRAVEIVLVDGWDK